MTVPRPVLSLLISLLAPRLDRATFINLIIYPMSQSTNTTRNPWSWVPSGYFAEGIPYVMITWVAATMFKDLGHSDTEITFWVGNITLMWSLKPLWAAFLDMFKTKKWIVLVMEFGMVSLMALVLSLIHI